MKKYAAAAILAALLSMSGSAPVKAAKSCGITPIAPIAPAGCQKMQPQCVCDSKGDNCRWTFVCVPYR